MTQVRLEPTAPRSRVKHTTTEPDCTVLFLYIITIKPAISQSKTTGQPTTPRGSLISAFVICFSESTISELAIGEISNFLLVFVAEETGLSLALSETPKDKFCRDKTNICMAIPILSLLKHETFCLLSTKKV